MGCREAPRVNLAAPAALRELLGAELRELPAREDELCVVGVFGKAATRLLSDKQGLVNSLCDRQVFPMFRRREEPEEEEEEGEVGHQHNRKQGGQEPQHNRKQGPQDQEGPQHNRKQGPQDQEGPQHNRKQGGQDVEEHLHNRKSGQDAEGHLHNRMSGEQVLEENQHNRKLGEQGLEEHQHNRKSGEQDLEEHQDYNRKSAEQDLEEHQDYSRKSGGQDVEEHQDYRMSGGQDVEEHNGYNRKSSGGQDVEEHQGYHRQSGEGDLEDEEHYDRKEEEEEELDLEEHQEQDYNLIQAYHCQESKVLFLVLTSVFDSHDLLEACVALGDDTPHAEAHDFWKQEEKLYCMHLLYLFSVCHILLLAHPTCSFDITYDKVFRALDTLRQKLLPSLKTAIKDCAVGIDWKLNCRSCPPRLLFVFQLNGALKVESKNLDPLNEKPKKHSPKRRLQHALEDQIYRIFRKSRVLTNQSVNCLFTVPANQAFVYIMPGQDEDPVGMLLEQLKHHCVLRDNESSMPISGPRRFQMMRHSRQLSFNIESNTSSSGQLVDCTLKEFLFQHVDLVLTKKGFDDSVGRNPQPSHFELPTYQKWISVALKLYETVIENKDDEPAPFIGGLTAKVLGNMKVLEGFLDADTKFSENRCQKALPMAHSAYQSNLPHNYTTTIHKNQLSQALRVYSQHARGPAFQKYAMHLSEDCYKFWSSGHQLCEERSLSDQHCVHKFHLLPKPGEKTEPERNPPILYHNSRARSTGSCNCGRKQAPRDDPFDIRSANYEFYKLLEEKCCGKLDHIHFPIFQPSTPDPAPAVNEEPDSPQEGEPEKIKDKEPQTQGESTSLSLALSLGQSMESLGTFPADPQAGGDNSEAHGQVAEAKPDKRPSLIDRQASTVEYLPGMLHSNCPKGLLPKFSSWSLLKLGSAKSYNFHTGLDQMGFIPGTNYLMPWDIVIRTRAEDEGDLDTNSWPAPNKAVPGKRNAVVMGRGRRRDDIARAFVGFEYEDSRGRRVMSSGPDKIMKVMGSGPKESAIKALNTDMPLYILSPSQGRGLKPHYAQLMRVYVVVPDAPLQIVLAPQVQPGPPPCPIFYPEKQDITLPPDGLWVLRFPYSYATEAGPCYPPKDNQQLMSFKVLRGVVKAITQ